MGSGYPLGQKMVSINKKSVSETKLQPVAIQQQTKKSWTIEDSEQLYGIEGWGEPYFSINAAGNITVSPQGASRGISLDLYELVESLKKKEYWITFTNSLLRYLG